jgi:hypothetical protein
MGCDYYICKKLCIYLKNNDNNFDIELETERGYFYDINMDEDDERYDEEYNKMIKQVLSVTKPPIVIFERDDFTSKKLENKYKRLIEQKMQSYNIEWFNIRKIVKKESRYERE